MQTKHWIGLAALIVLILAVVGVVVAATGTTKFPMNSTIAFINDGAVPINMQLEVHTGDVNGAVVYSATRSIAAGAEWEVDMGTISQIPAGFSGTALANSDSPFRAEYRLKGFSLPFSVHNWSTSPGTIDIRYLRAGVVMLVYNDVPIASDQTVRITAGQYAPPPNYDAVVIGSTVAIEGYYSSANMEIRKK